MNTVTESQKWTPMSWVRQLYDWVVKWSDTRYAGLALFLIAFAESSFFPIPPDVLLIAMGVAAAKKSLRFALICLIGSVTGGMFGYALGLGLWSSLDQFFFQYIPGFTPELFNTVAGFYQENVFWAVFTAGFTPIPYKIFTVTAGATQVSFAPFVLASIFGRGLRFFIVGFLLWGFGAKVQTLIEKYFNLFTIVFTVLLVGGVFAVKFLV